MFPDLMRDDVFRLETDRLWLRWPRASDAMRIAEYAGDSAVALVTANIPYPYPPGAAAEFVLTTRGANFTGRQIGGVLTLKQRPNETIGCMALKAAGNDEAMLGYWLGKPYWRQGLASEAAMALVNLALRSTEIAAVTASVRPENVASRGVLSRLGFTPEGFGVATAPARGGSVPVERFRLTRAAWSGNTKVTRALQLARAN